MAEPDGLTTRDLAAQDADPSDDGGGREPLLPSDQGEQFSERWREIQTSFVDEPRSSVERADALVAELMQKLATGFSQERARLEEQWDRSDDSPRKTCESR